MHKTHKVEASRPVKHHIDRRAEQTIEIVLANGDPDEALSPNATARLLGLSTNWLAIARHKGHGPRFT